MTMTRLGATLALALGLAASPWALGQNLGTAASYAVLAGSAVTNTGPTIVTGDLGVSPGTSITGFPPGSVIGTTNSANAAAALAQNDLTTAFNFLAAQPCGTTLTGDLGGRTLTPGVYCMASSAQLTGTLTLDAQGNPNATFIFQIGSTLTTASNAAVALINTGRACNVFWQIGSSATLGTGTNFAGSILAQASVTLNTGARLSGRALARTGAVTLDSSPVTVCAAPVCPAITVNPATLPGGTIGVAYSQTVSASGSTSPPTTFTVSSGALPGGLSLNASGVIAGTPTTAGLSSFTITATDAAACPASRAYSILVSAVACPAITLSPASLPNGQVGQAYNQVVVASPAGTYAYAVQGGSLPPGISINAATGALAGVPTSPGTFSFTVTATAAGGCGGAQLLVLTVAAAVATASAAEPIPTLSEWAMILLALLLAGFGVAAMRRQGR